MSSSEITIQPAKSFLYCRLTLAVYVITGFFLMICGLLPWLKLLFLAVMLWQILAVFKTKTPYPRLRCISHRQNVWTLSDEHDREYSELKMLLDSGFFQLLRFSKDSGERRLLVLFQDQLTDSQHRQLQFTLTTASKSTV